MARPKKKKVEMAVPAAEEGAEVEGDACIVASSGSTTILRLCIYLRHILTFVCHVTYLAYAHIACA